MLSGAAESSPSGYVPGIPVLIAYYHWVFQAQVACTLTLGDERCGIVQLKEEEERIEESEAETRKKMKTLKEHTKKWEETRENRVLLFVNNRSTIAASGFEWHLVL